eukprot:1693353-Amphidinium_carterae.2
MQTQSDVETKVTVKGNEVIVTTVQKTERLVQLMMLLRTVQMESEWFPFSRVVTGSMTALRFNIVACSRSQCERTAL